MSRETVEIIPWFKGHAIKVLTKKEPCAWDPGKFDTEHQIRGLTNDDLRRLRDAADAALTASTPRASEGPNA